MVVWLQIFRTKKMSKEKALCKCLSIIILDSNYQSNEKILSSNTLGRMQIWKRKDKNGELHWWWYRKKFLYRFHNNLLLYLINITSLPHFLYIVKKL